MKLVFESYEPSKYELARSAFALCALPAREVELVLLEVFFAAGAHHALFRKVSFKKHHLVASSAPRSELALTQGFLQLVQLLLAFQVS